MSFPFYPARPTRIWHGDRTWQQIVGSPMWSVEPKIDDWRVLIVWHVGSVECWSRHGKPLALTLAVRDVCAHARLAPGSVIDGGLLGPRTGTEQSLVAFDLPVVGGTRHTGAYDVRRTDLIAAGLPVISRWLNNEAAWERVLQHNEYEGLVFKRRDASYPFARTENDTTPLWLKVRKEKT